FTERTDDRTKLTTRLCQVIFRSQSPLPALDNPDRFELLEPSTEQAPRYQRNSAVQIAEMRAAEQQLAQDQRRPALGKDLGAFGDRAILAVAFHGGPPLVRDMCAIDDGTAAPASTDS